MERPPTQLSPEPAPPRPSTVRYEQGLTVKAPAIPLAQPPWCQTRASGLPYPQLFIKGEFVGGCDIITEMTLSGELDTMFEANGVGFDKEMADKIRAANA